jgi:hypothetical protein
MNIHVVTCHSSRCVVCCIVKMTREECETSSGGVVSSTVDHHDGSDGVEDADRTGYLLTRIKTEEYSPQSGA